MEAIDVPGASDPHTSIRLAEEEDKELVHSLLAPSIVIGISSNAKTRQTKKLDGFIRKGIIDKKVILLYLDDVAIGACIYDDHIINTIWHINILKEYRMRRSTGLLMHYLVNVVFEGEAVFFRNDTKSYESIAERDGNNYKIKPFFADFIKRTI